MLLNNRIKSTFLLLVLAQGLHSIEEYIGKLWEVFSPAKFLTGLISSNHKTGFLVINILLFIFGIWCWLVPIRKNHSSAIVFITSWVIIELINGIGHPLWSLTQSNYTPGVVTAPLLLALSLYLAYQLLDKKSKTS